MVSIFPQRFGDATPEWAWAPYEPCPERPWDVGRAGHLLRRAGLGGSPDELQRALERGPEGTIDALLAASEGAELGGGIQEEGEDSAARSGDGDTYNAWWLRRLVESTQPLRETLTLFWHEHFAISSQDAGDLALFHQHVQALRHGALGDIGSLYESMLSDPAMFVALGGAQNRKSQLRLPFARVWLEVYGVGSDAVHEDDVRAAARALTGWFVYGGRLRFIAREHDDGEKTILGRSGRFGREHLKSVVVEHPLTAQQLAAGLFSWFLSETVEPPRTLLQPLADALTRSEGIRACVATLLRSNLFFSEHAIGQKVKSPVELAVGLSRACEFVPPTLRLARDLAQLGQRLDQPPTVQGWAGGADWINSITVAARQRLCVALLEGAKGYGKGVDFGKLARSGRPETAERSVELWRGLLMPRGPTPARQTASRHPGSGLRSSALTAVVQPEFQLS